MYHLVNLINSDLFNKLSKVRERFDMYILKLNIPFYVVFINKDILKEPPAS